MLKNFFIKKKIKLFKQEKNNLIIIVNRITDNNILESRGCRGFFCVVFNSFPQYKMTLGGQERVLYRGKD